MMFHSQFLVAMGPSIYDVHTEGEGEGSGGRMWTGASPMWTSTQKIILSSSHAKKLVYFYQNSVFGRNKKWKIFGDIN